jgi:hypothetical protein
MLRFVFLATQYYAIENNQENDDGKLPTTTQESNNNDGEKNLLIAIICFLSAFIFLLILFWIWKCRVYWRHTELIENVSFFSLCFFFYTNAASIKNFWAKKYVCVKILSQNFLNLKKSCDIFPLM